MKRILWVLSVLLVSVIACVPPSVPAEGDVWSFGSYGTFTAENSTIVGSRFGYNPSFQGAPGRSGFDVAAVVDGDVAVRLNVSVESGPPPEWFIVDVGTISGPFAPPEQHGNATFTVLSGDDSKLTYAGTFTVTEVEYGERSFNNGGYVDPLTKLRGTFSIALEGEIINGVVRIG